VNTKRLLFVIALSLPALAAVLYLGERHWRPSLRDRFERVPAGMSAAEVRRVMGTPGDERSDRRPLVSGYAEVWRLSGGVFARREYRGSDVHIEVGLTGQTLQVWKTDGAVAVVEFDGGGRVCGKLWLTE
jgi:hypothetical protein